MMQKTFAPSNRRTQTLLGQLSFPNQVQTAVKNQAPSLLSGAGRDTTNQSITTRTLGHTKFKKK